MSRRDTVLKYFDKYKNFMDTVVETGIEKNRKGNAYLEVVDTDGHPISGAEVTACQKNHNFKYGANIFMLDELESDEKNSAYRDAFKDIFNLATLPFYWSDLEPVQGKPRYAKGSPKIYRRPAPDLCVEYCLENGIEPKAHCLNYDNYTPQWLKDADVEYHKRMLNKHFKELSERYADVIPSWEVTNETLLPYDHYNSAFYRQDDFVEWSFRTADRYFPTNRLIINDFYIWYIHSPAYRDNRSPYYMQIERLGFKGITHLDSIGMQFHCFSSRESEGDIAPTFYNPVFLYEVFDKYAQLGKKIQITEMTVPAYSDSDEDEQVQAELIEKLYTVFFSHPAMEAVIYWNLVDGYAAFAPQGDMTAGENKFFGGLMNFDLSKKRAYHTIKKLFSEKWHTVSRIATDINGKAEFRGFYGDYELTIKANGKEIKKDISLLPAKNNINQIII